MPDPIEGFQVVGYDASTETLTIAVHKSLLKDQKATNTMADRAVEIMVGGPSVSKVVFVPRD